MRSLSAALSTALGAPVQQPALLVEIGYATPARYSSFATITWNGLTWTREDVAVEDLVVRALQVQGTLVIGNNDNAAGTAALAAGLVDRSIRLWGYDAAATATADVVWLADAVAGVTEISPRALRIQLRHPCELVTSPRTFVGPAAGFNTLLPAGTVLRINGLDVRLERQGS